MPRYRRNRSKPWMASVNSPEGKNVYLGYYATWDEARCIELDHGGKLYVRNPTIPKGEQDDERLHTSRD